MKEMKDIERIRRNPPTEEVTGSPPPSSGDVSTTENGNIENLQDPTEEEGAKKGLKGLFNKLKLKKKKKIQHGVSTVIGDKVEENGLSDQKVESAPKGQEEKKL